MSLNPGLKRKFRPEPESNSDDSSTTEDESDSDSDAAIQEAFAQGKIKPGLNIENAPKKKKVNNVPLMLQLLEGFMNKAPWVERLDIVTDLAPLGAEMALQVEREEQKRANLFKGNAKIPKVKPELDPVLNDFKREIHFQRQGQAAAIEGLRRLKELGIPTKRPDDYFAEMAKSDDHMQKVRKMLMAKQEGQQKSERVRQLREQKKMAKVLQKQANDKKAGEKRKMLDDVKAFRKGKLKSLDFLEDKKGKKSGGGGKSKAKGKGKRKVSEKREFKNEKYGFGGRKKDSKRNTKESFLGAGKGGKGKGGKSKKPVRPGKSKRAQMKGRGKNSRR